MPVSSLGWTWADRLGKASSLPGPTSIRCMSFMTPRAERSIRRCTSHGAIERRTRWSDRTTSQPAGSGTTTNVQSLRPSTPAPSTHFSTGLRITRPSCWLIAQSASDCPTQYSASFWRRDGWLTRQETGSDGVRIAHPRHQLGGELARRSLVGAALRNGDVPRRPGRVRGSALSREQTGDAWQQPQTAGGSSLARGTPSILNMGTQPATSP